MDYDETEINVNLKLLGEYNIEKGKNYQYINVDTLSFDLKNAIIEKLENSNEMPNNFLKFVYETNLDNLRTIYSEEKLMMTIRIRLNILLMLMYPKHMRKIDLG